MKHLVPILALVLASCATPMDETSAQKECCMPTPLDDFANSPRRFRNDDGSEIVSSSLVKLGPGIVASRPNGAPGEATFVTLDVPEVASLQTQIDALALRVTALEEQLAAATAANTPGALVMRDNNGDIFAGAFRGNIKERSNGADVKILTYSGQEVFRAGENGGNPSFVFFNAGAKALQQQLSISSPTLAQDHANQAQTYGLTTIIP